MKYFELNVLDSQSMQSSISSWTGYIWKVPKSSSCPEGVAYSLVCVRKGRRLIGYDNENHGTGISNHHKHVGERIVPYAFVDEWKLLEDFSKELDKIRRGVIQ